MLLVVTVLWCATALAVAGEVSGATHLDEPGSAQVPCGWVGDNLLGGLDGRVWAIESYQPSWSQNDPVQCVAGEFQSAGGLTVHHIGVWDGTGWRAVSGSSGVGTDGPVYALARLANLAFDYIGAGGSFTSAGGLPAANLAIFWTDWEIGWDTNGPVYALSAPWGGGEYEATVGGAFTEFEGMPVSSIAQCCWISPGGGVSGEVYALDARAAGSWGAFYAGGWFQLAGGTVVNNVALWDGTGWVPLSGPSGTGANGRVRAVRKVGGNVFAGGAFTSAGGVTVNHVGRWDGSRWWPMTGPTEPGTDLGVLALGDTYYGMLYAGGLFTKAGGVNVNHIARWDGIRWSALEGPYGTGTDGWVYAIEAVTEDSGPVLYVGGSFSTAGGLPAANIAKWVCEAYPPSDPTVLASSSHVVATWSNQSVVDVWWSGAVDSGGSAVAGYSYLFDEGPATIPDPTLELLHTSDPHGVSSAALADGTSHYVHVLTRDGAGNSSAGLHLGPFWIDTTPPGAAALSSPSHQVGVASGDQTVDLLWIADGGDLSGVDGFATDLNGEPTWTCDLQKDFEEDTTSMTTTPLAAGSWYFHLCTADNAGNWSDVSSIGPFVIIPGLVFADGFESGNSSAWSVVVPGAAGR